MFPGPIKAAALAAVIIGVASYLAENSQPILAGIITTIPVALPAMWFLGVKDPQEFKDYTWAFTLGIASYFIAIMTFYYMCAYKEIPKKTAILYAMGLWLGLVVLAYFIFAERGPHRR